MNDTTNDVLRRLVAAHSPELDSPSEIADTSSLAGIGIDSLEMLSLALDIENAVDVELDNVAVASVRTFGELVTVVGAALRPDRR